MRELGLEPKQYDSPDLALQDLVNGNIDAVLAVESGWMTATAWEQSEEEGRVLVQALKEAMEAGKNWKPEAREVPPILLNARRLRSCASVNSS